MDYRNRKGQVLIEATLLVFIFIALFIVFANLIKTHKREIGGSKLSRELKRSFQNEGP